MTAVHHSSQQKIAATLGQLRRCTQVDVLSQWQIGEGQFSPSEFPQVNHWPIAALNSRGHIGWQRGKKVIWLAQQIEVPSHLQDYPLAGCSLRLSLKWWAETAEIYLQGQQIQSGDLFDCSTRILLSPKVTVGDRFWITIRLVSPAHDDGALVQSCCLYEVPENQRIDPGFFANEIEVISIRIHSNQNLVKRLADTLDEIDWSTVSNPEKFERSLSQVRHQLLPFSDDIQPLKIGLLGHAHLDLAWLWPVAETWEAAQRTFESVLQLQQRFPDLIFTHSSPALFAWIEVHRPDLFAAIVEKVQLGSWEIAAGLWVEPELNIIGGESIVRQILYGQRYVQAKFGHISEVAWLPDSFGFCWQLPQLLRQGGIRYFVTQKLRWNDTTKFPHELFWWEGLDGSQILSLMSALIGQEIDPISMANYATDWQEKTNLNMALWLPGVGDHGGGPTQDMLEVAQRWQQSPFFPKLEFIQAVDYLRQLEQEGTQFPVWQDELYLEFHRGCYTTHADQKRWNRRCEQLLYQAELFASIATLLTGIAYPKAELERAWKQVLFNQFHDILPGSGIPEVYTEANQTWQAAELTAQEILEASLNAIATEISFPSPPTPEAIPILVFNPLNWQRSEMVSVPLSSASEQGNIWDAEGMALNTQHYQHQRQFIAQNIPPVGYKLFWWIPQNHESENQQHAAQHYSTSLSDFCAKVNPDRKVSENYVLENEYLAVYIDDQTGDIRRIFDKVNQREVLQSVGGNQLQFFQDQGQYWDAWNIDPNYENYPLSPATLKEINWIKQGNLEWQLQVIRVWGKSEFCQDYILQQGSPLLKIETRVNWQDRHVLVKVAFPLTVEADFATTEIPCGAMSRTTRRQTDVEKAKWEIPALNWVDLGNENYGVSLINNCKYGYDLQPCQIRLTLLRGSAWPDPNADLGQHQLSYGIYPHRGSWKTANVVQRGYEFNQSLLVMQPFQLNSSSIHDSSPGQGSFLNLQSDHLILMVLKQGEQDPEQWIFRCYECHGETETLTMQNNLGLVLDHPVNLLEQPLDSSSPIQPWQVASFQMHCDSESPCDVATNRV